MCLYTRNAQPFVAERDIECIKYLNRSVSGHYVTPCQNTRVELNATIVAQPDKPQISKDGTDDFENTIYTLSGGAIHAKLVRQDDMGSCRKKAIIPKGTKYWLDPFGMEIAAEKMLITSEDTDGISDLSMAEDILAHAPQMNGIHIGDFQLEDGSFIRPNKSVKEKHPVGRVVGFHNGKPLVAALEFFREMWDREWNSHITEHIDERAEAIKRFDGEENTKAYKKLRTKGKKERYPAHEKCASYDAGKNFSAYFPALGEIMTMLDNAIYLNASYAVSGLGFIIDNRYWWWSSSEGSQDRSWDCCLNRDRVGCDWLHEDYAGSVCPFLASKKKLNSLWNQITKAFSRK